jgi:hypothetical protein
MRASLLGAVLGFGGYMSDQEFLEALKDYIEDMEDRVENEWGNCRGIDELKAQGKMPEIYNEVLRRLGLA